MNAREAAYLALCASSKGAFIVDVLNDWQKASAPSTSDFHLAHEIAYGTERMRLALDYLALKGSECNKLSIKSKERILIRTAIYQMFFMDRVPHYAIVNESVNIARKHCHKTFVSFLNAILRKLSAMKFDLPQGDSIASLGIRFSYPDFFVKALITDYGIESAKNILSSGNNPAPIMTRIRNMDTIEKDGISKDFFIQGLDKTYAAIPSTIIPKIAKSSSYYIQNVTPGALMEHLANTRFSPTTVLDLCASPGGKLLIAHDIFPKAQLFGNDVSKEKLATLQENLNKYEMSAEISCGYGEDYQAPIQFDLIILDVPCSNTGVLNKRPEARWRLEPQTLSDLEKKQLSLIEHASKLLAKDGEIWYMTCSILKSENDGVIQNACEQFQLKVRTQKTILPNLEGWDGGFGCALRKISGSSKALAKGQL